MKKALTIFLILLIIAGLFIVFSFYGNPISKVLAARAADSYIENTYPDHDFERRKVFYNFKTGAYTVFLKDKSSPDTAFEIGFDFLGRLKYDNYDQILFNTWTRFAEGLRAYGRNLEKSANKAYHIDLMISDTRDYREVLTLDQEVDMEDFPLEVSASLESFSKDPSFEEALDLLKDLDQTLEATSLKISDYAVRLIPEADKAPDGQAQTWENSLFIFDIPVETVRTGSIEDLKALYEDQSKPIEDKDY